MTQRPQKYARIAITIPESDLAAADRLAKIHDRSRSWIVAEAVRRYTSSEKGASSEKVTSAEKEIVSPAHKRGLGESRLAQLIQDLSLTPEARIRAAEETSRMSERSGGRRTHVMIGFDSYDDFLAWKQKPDAQR